MSKIEIEIEKGAASMNIELKDGVITVRHGTDNEVLLTTVATQGSWGSIWEKLRSIKSSYDSQKFVCDTIEKHGEKNAMKKLKVIDGGLA